MAETAEQSAAAPVSVHYRPSRLAPWFRAGLVLAFVYSLPAVFASAVPDSDIRNIEVPNHKTHFRMREYKTREQWNARRDQLRKQILSSAGLLPMPVRTPLHPMIVRQLSFSDYSVQSVLLETFPGLYLGCNVYLPMNVKGPAPGILLPHGHWKGGRLENQPSYSVPALAINLARQGYVVLTYDMVGYNDTRQMPHDFGGWNEDLWSFHPMGVQLWNSTRALDYLESLHEVDPRRIAMTGASGGATQTFLLAAIDDRIRFAAPVNMVSAYMQGGDPCEEAPGLRRDTFNVEFAAMIAPRPMLVISCTRDWTRHTPTEEFPAIQHIYDLLGASENVHNAHFDAEHNYNRQSREAVYRFFNRQLHPERPSIKDEDVTPPPDGELLAFAKSDTLANLPPYEQIFDRWKASAVMQMQAIGDTGMLRETLRVALGAEWPNHVDSRTSANHIVLTRPGLGDRVTGYFFPGKGNPVLFVHPESAFAAMQMNVVEEVRKSGRPVLIIDPFRDAVDRTSRRQYDEYFLSYNRSESAIRVQDVLTALCFLKEQYRGKPELIGLGESGPTAVFAAAVAPVPVDVLADLNGFGGSDQDFRTRFFVPGIQRVGGLNTALRLTTSLRAAIPAPSGTPAGEDTQTAFTNDQNPR